MNQLFSVMNDNLNKNSTDLDLLRTHPLYYSLAFTHIRLRIKEGTCD